MTNPTLTEKDVAEIASSLTKAQKVVAMRCGDVIDSFPCCLCGAKGPSDCGVSIGNRRAAADAINACATLDTATTRGRHGYDNLRNHLISTPNMPKGDRADG
ncbi:MAG TPA: hypothetical protein VF637_07695 [Sphingomicrobium sp.]|jgi:hypothetical protein